MAFAYICEKYKRMTSIKYSYNILIILFLLSSCCTHKPFKQHEKGVAAQFPKLDIPIPASDFHFVFPEAPELAVCHAPKKDITTTFSSRDMGQVSVKDPKLFKDGDSEIINLALIPEGEYAYPLPNGKVISPYAGRRRHHSGIDIKTFPRDTIVAAFDGIVRMAKPFAAYGNVIVVRHYNGLETIYSHNSKNLVKPGDLVKAGEPIALTGRTGRATTEHLHFEVRINGVHFNPELLFDTKSRRLQTKCLICTNRGNHIRVKAVDMFPHQKMQAYKPSYIK